MEEKKLNPLESLQIIDAMISRAKNKLADDGFLLIFWGWLVFVSAIVSYAGLAMGMPYLLWVWVILMPVGGVVSMIYGMRQGKKDKTRTHIDTYLGYSWTAFIVALFITLVFISVHGVKTTYFFLMILYGMATLISGGLLNFRPLVLGSLFSFLAAIVSVFLGNEEQFLCLAFSVLCSYILPGHLLRAKFKSQVNV